MTDVGPDQGSDYLDYQGWGMRGDRGRRPRRSFCASTSMVSRAPSNLGELGIGLNPKARIGDLITETKKALGTAHFALGDNAGGYGGVVESDVHLDGLNLSVSIWVDGVPLVRDGELLVWSVSSHHSY